MTFTPEQTALLEAPLYATHVKTRQQAGRTLSYIEGWVAIAEANRIFGFDGWARETIYCKEVSRQNVEIGQQKRPGWKVGYEAKVRVTVGDVVREGTGHGMGSMTDLYDCIESAAKEAETDAMKRALMTFGNSFGLALYDKEQRNVSRDGGLTPEADQRMADGIVKMLNKDVSGLPRNEQEWRDWFESFKPEITGCVSNEAVDAKMKLHKAEIVAMQKSAPDIFADVRDFVQGHREILNTPTGDTIIGGG